LSCGQRSKPQQLSIKPAELSDSISLHKAEFISETWPEFKGLFSIGDSVNRIDNDTLNGIDLLSYDLADSREEKKIVDISTDGLKMYVDYDKYVKPAYEKNKKLFYYTVYFANETPVHKFVTIKDGGVLALQEAQYRDGNWYPIEWRGTEDCLNGGMAVKVLPNQFITFSMKKYHGDFATNLRIRFENGRQIYISEPFEGYIDERQFYFENQFTVQLFKDNIESACSFRFYDAIPLQLAVK
jgi:hypothetical protein